MLLGRRIILANVMDEDEQTGLIRHDPQQLARVLLRWYGRVQGLFGGNEQRSEGSKNWRGEGARSKR